MKLSNPGISHVIRVIVVWLAVGSAASGAVAGVVELAQTGQTTSYAAGDDGALEVGVAWPAPRFTANGDGTLTDELTGLVWLANANCANSVMRDPQATGDGSMYYSSAISFVADINSGIQSIGACGYTGSASDWRFANIVELESLMNAGVADQISWLGGQGFFGLAASYWTSTTWLEENVLRAFTLTTADGEFGNALKESSVRWVMLVRSGPTGSADPSVPANLWKPGSNVTSGHGVAWPFPRMIDNGDGTVTDELTGLMWLKDMSCLGSGSWGTALATVADFNLPSPTGSYDCGADYEQGRYRDWRLANRKEMFSLLDINESRPALPVSNPFVNVPTFGVYPSSTSGTIPASEFWKVETWIFSAIESEPKSSTFYSAWAVRTPADAAVPGLSAWGLVATGLALTMVGIGALSARKRPRGSIRPSS